MSSSSVLVAPHPKVRRLTGVSGAARPSVLWGAGILCAAILIAAVSTVDPLWWHLHFSRLGMFADASGFTFNGGVIFSGLMIAAAGVPMALRLATGMSTGRIADPRAARMLPPLLIALGVSLAMIGVVPLTLNEFLHDRAANGVLLSFLGLVVFSRRTLPELPAFLGTFAIVAIVLLSVGIALMVSGIINLAAFEVLAFGSVLSWVHLLEQSVKRLGAEAPDRGASAHESSELESLEHTAPSPAARRDRVDVVRRGVRRRIPASLAASRATSPTALRSGSSGSPTREREHITYRSVRGRPRPYPLARQWRRARDRRQL